MATKYSRNQIEVFKLKARIRKLEKDKKERLEKRFLFVGEEAIYIAETNHELQRLRNRLQQAERILERDGSV